MASEKTGAIKASFGTGAQKPVPITSDDAPIVQKVVADLITQPAALIYEGGAYENIMSLAAGKWFQSNSLIDIPLNGVTNVEILNLAMYNEYMNELIKFIIMVHDRWFGSIDYRITWFGASTVVGGIEVGQTVIHIPGAQINDLRVIKGETMALNNAQVWTCTLGPTVPAGGIKYHFFSMTDEQGVPNFQDPAQMNWSGYPHVVVLQNVGLQTFVASGVTSIKMRIESKLGQDFRVTTVSLARIRLTVDALMRTYSQMRSTRFLGPLGPKKLATSLNGLSLEKVFDKQQLYLSLDGAYEVDSLLDPQFDNAQGRMDFNGKVQMLWDYVQTSTANINTRDSLTKFVFLDSSVDLKTADGSSIIASVSGIGGGYDPDNLNAFLVTCAKQGSLTHYTWSTTDMAGIAQYGFFRIALTKNRLDLRIAGIDCSNTLVGGLAADLTDNRFADPDTVLQVLLNQTDGIEAPNGDPLVIRNLTDISYIGKPIEMIIRKSARQQYQDSTTGGVGWGDGCYTESYLSAYNVSSIADSVDFVLGATGLEITNATRQSKEILIPFMFAVYGPTGAAVGPIAAKDPVMQCMTSMLPFVSGQLFNHKAYATIGLHFYTTDDIKLSDFSYAYSSYIVSPSIDAFHKVPERARRVVFSEEIPGNIVSALIETKVPTISTLQPKIFPDLEKGNIVHFELISPNNSQTLFSMVYDGGYKCFYMVPSDQSINYYSTYNTRDCQHLIIRNAYLSTIGNSPPQSIATDFLSRIVTGSTSDNLILKKNSGPSISTMVRSMFESYKQPHRNVRSINNKF